MDYNKLRTFIEVAKTGSVSKAANNLFRTQPAITQQIQALENDLELALLERKNGKISLTKQGQQLFEFSKHRLREIDDFLSEVKNDSESLTGEIKIGIRQDVALHMLPIVFANFKMKYPNIKFTVIHGDAMQTEQRVLNNEVDVGIQLLVRERKALKVYDVKAKTTILAAGKKYLNERGRPKTVSDLLEHDIIDYTEDCDAIAYWCRVVDKSLENSFRKRRPQYICPDHGFAAELIRKNLGIGGMPIYLIEEDLKKGLIEEVLPKVNPRLKMGFSIVVKKYSNPSAAEKAFLDVLLKELC